MSMIARTAARSALSAAASRSSLNASCPTLSSRMIMASAPQAIQFSSFSVFSKFFGDKSSNAKPVTPAAPSSSASNKTPAMLCFQCEQTRDNVGCKTVGVCGKLPTTAALQDVIMHIIRGIGLYADAAIRIGGTDYQSTDIDHYVMNASFSTMTNVNFDDLRMIDYVQQGLKYRNAAKSLYEKACKAKGVAVDPFISSSPFATYVPISQDLSQIDQIVAEAKELGIYRRKERDGDDLVGLQELSVYGLKGLLAYAHHATTLGKTDPKIFAQVHRLFASIANPKSGVPELLAAAMDVGKLNLQVMSMLDDGHTSQFGHPSPHQVNCKPIAGKAILISGHDLLDLHDLLEQTKGTGVNVYTHGEMLPAHGYPELRKYPHLAGHFGSAWQSQKFEFGSFPGPIIMTSNCIIEPAKSYKHRIYTMNTVGYAGVKHLKNRDFSQVIAQAKAEEGFNADNIDTLAKGPLTVGFARNTIMTVADKVLAAVQGGAVKRIAFVGGCDGTEGERNYFTKLAQALPNETVFLTAGCGKFRINRTIKGDIAGLPRVLDMGQCNDSYSGIMVAVALANALKTDVNSLPLSFAVSWLEQKAVAVLLTLLHLNIKNIHLGPALPAFATPTMIKILNEKFGLQQVNSADPLADAKLIMQGK